MGFALVLDFIYTNKPDANTIYANHMAPYMPSPDAFIVKVVRCFSPYTNLKKIAKTTDTNASGQIGCFNGMR